MTDLHPAAMEILEGDTLAMLTTLDADGTPQVTGVWVALEDGELVTAHLGLYRKLRNVQRDPRVVFTLVPGTVNDHGLHEYLVIHGRARVTEGGAPELLDRLAKVYIAPDATWPPTPDPPPGYVLRTTIERVTGSGPWA